MELLGSRFPFWGIVGIVDNNFKKVFFIEISAFYIELALSIVMLYISIAVIKHHWFTKKWFQRQSIDACTVS